MAELGILLGSVVVAILVALLDRWADRSVQVVRGTGHRSAVRRAIDRMRHAATSRTTRTTEDGAGGKGSGEAGSL